MAPLEKVGAPLPALLLILSALILPPPLQVVQDSELPYQFLRCLEQNHHHQQQ